MFWKHSVEKNEMDILCPVDFLYDSLGYRDRQK
jgi:hypothetical protein